MIFTIKDKSSIADLNLTYKEICERPKMTFCTLAAITIILGQIAFFGCVGGWWQVSYLKNGQKHAKLAQSGMCSLYPLIGQVLYRGLNFWRIQGRKPHSCGSYYEFLNRGFVLASFEMCFPKLFQKHILACQSYICVLAWGCSIAKKGCGLKMSSAGWI